MSFRWPRHAFLIRLSTARTDQSLRKKFFLQRRISGFMMKIYLTGSCQFGSCAMISQIIWLTPCCIIDRRAIRLTVSPAGGVHHGGRSGQFFEQVGFWLWTYNKPYPSVAQEASVISHAGDRVSGHCGTLPQSGLEIG